MGTVCNSVTGRAFECLSEAFASDRGVTEYVFTGRQIYLCLLEEVPIKPSAFIVKREMFEKSGVFDEAWPSGTDWDLFIRLSDGLALDILTCPWWSKGEPQTVPSRRIASKISSLS